MTTKIGPNITCLFMEYFEELSLLSMYTPHQYYLNDILTILLELHRVLNKELRFINFVSNFIPSMK